MIICLTVPQLVQERYREQETNAAVVLEDIKNWQEGNALRLYLEGTLKA